MNGYLPIALVLRTLDYSFAPSATLMTIVDMITFASSEKNVTVISLFCFGANVPVNTNSNVRYSNVPQRSMKMEAVDSAKI